MTVGSLFSGIGGLDLGFERAGFEIRWMCEKDEYCRRVLNKHWPKVPIHEDITTLTDPEPVDVLIGGFPCQDISNAGTGAGINGSRSGLWREMLRLVRVVRPRYVVMENVAAITHRGMGSVLWSLAKVGYDAEWEVISACAFGAPHPRARMFIVAHTDGARKLQQERGEPDERRRLGNGCAQGGGQAWPDEPRMARMAHGVSARLDRERALGNAVVPRVAEYVAHCVRRHAEETGQWQPA